MSVPNTFQTFNWYIDRAMQHLTDAELRVMLFATRHIMGWRDRVNDRKGRISLSTFQKGFTTEKGERFCGCGLSRPIIVDALESLVKFGFLHKIGAADAKGQTWELGEEIDWETLEKRTADRQQSTKRQTAKATAASKQKREKKRTGTLDVPVDKVVRQTYQNQYVERTDTGTLDVHIQTHIQTQEKDSAPQADADTPSLKLVDSKPRNELFDAVAKHVFETDDPGATGGRIAKISNWLSGKYEGRGESKVGKISSPAKPEHVEKFVKAWRKDNPRATPPRDFVKFVEAWRSWASKLAARQAVPPPVPLPPEVEGWGVDTFVRTPAGKAG